MEGFLNLRFNPWLRRLLTRGLALAPAVFVIMMYGEGQVYRLLILSQVVLSLQLPFAIIPLIRLTSDRERMGEFANRPWVVALAGLVAAIILFLNGWLVKRTIDEFIASGTNVYFLIGGAGALGALLVYMLVEPFVHRRTPAAAGPVAMPVPEVAGGDGQALPEYRAILVPLDHSASDRIAIRHALALAKQSNARLMLLHVEEGATSQVYGPESSTAEVAGGSAYLQEIAKQVSLHAVRCDFLIRHSTSPTEEIVRFVRDEQPDLIVMAAHGHGRIGDLVYGQTIEQVRHAVKIPVFVVQ